MIWYHIEDQPQKSVGAVQVRGIKEPLTKGELIHHIDKLWERYYAEKEAEA